MKQTPLEIALTKIKNCCCNNCEWLVKVKSINYCRSSGKVILEMHLDSVREVQCKDVFKRKEETMTIRRCIENFKFKTERFIVISNDSEQYDFFLSDLGIYEVEQFVPRKVLDSQLAFKKSYKKDGVETILLHWESEVK